MNIIDYIALNPTTTLQELQDYEEVVDTKQVGSGQARGYFVNTNNLWKRLRDIQDDRNHIFYGVADTIIATALDANSYFGMDIDKADGQANRLALTALVSSSIVTQTEADDFIAKALTTIKPFENITESQLNSVKGIHSSRPIDITHNQDIIITLNTTLPSKVSAVLWMSEQDYEDENLGKSVIVKDINKYRLHTGTLRGSYEVRVPFDNVDFTVEAY